MKDRFLPYFQLQLRRARHFLPSALLIGLILLLIVGALAVSSSASYNNNDNNGQVLIGVVGTIEEPYFEAMIDAINNLDSAGLSLSLVRMDESTAQHRLETSEISSYVVIPEGFEERIITDDPLKLTFVQAPTASGISTFLAYEVIEAIAPILMEGQNSMYGLAYYERDMAPEQDKYQEYSRVTNEYVALILNRGNLYETVETGIVAGQGFVPFLLMSLTTFFMLIWGVACVPLFSARHHETDRILLTHGLGSAGQIAAEYLSYLALTFVGVVSAFLITGVCMRLAAPDIVNSLFADREDVVRFLLRMLLIATVFAALQFMLYELARSTVAALLLQTLTAVFMGYVCGCFYSSTYFPQALQRFSAYLPAGAAIHFLTGTQPGFGLVLAGYFVLFMLVILWKRSSDLAGDAV